MNRLDQPIALARRHFVQGLALGSTFAGIGLGPGALLAASQRMQGLQALRGTDFHSTIGEQAVNFIGAARIATTVNGLLPAPILRWREGDTITLPVTNRLSQGSSIHWHGIILPSAIEGVPHIANDFPGIGSGGIITYRFPVRQSGAFWCHSHSGFQEQTGPNGPIVIDPREPSPFSCDRADCLFAQDIARRVLSYADLKNRHDTAGQREPDRELGLHLTGSMGRYMCSINGVKHGEAEPSALEVGKAAAHLLRQRHHEEPPDAPAWHVERPGERRQQFSATRTHPDRAAWLVTPVTGVTHPQGVSRSVPDGPPRHRAHGLHTQFFTVECP